MSRLVSKPTNWNEHLANTNTQISLGINISRGTLRMLMNVKIMFDRYYCINSTRTHRKLRKCLHPLFFTLTTIFLRAQVFFFFINILDSGCGQVLFLVLI